MLSKLKKSNNKGFTIIEVMIVLAIAGLIILIVLLAVPALQRNARNTAIKNDASAVASGVAEFASNNDGATPSKANGSAGGTGTITLTNTSVGAGVVKSSPKIQGGTVVNLGADKTAATITPNAGELTVTFGTKCSAPNGIDKYDIVASARATSIVYAIESGSQGTVAKCLDS